MSKKKLILIIITLGFFLRLINLNFPFLSNEETRIASRGYTIATTGKDELGRTFPVIFNSLEDYQMPVNSYLTAAGEFFLGKSELGVRLPFIFIGTLSIWLTYVVAGIFDTSQKFRLLAALLVALSPVLIFLSKVPNESILLTFLFLLLFYFLTRKIISVPIIIFCFGLILLTSKIAWFTLFPFTAFTLLFFRQNLSKSSKLVVIISLVLTFSAFSILLKMPQGLRSLLENNLSIFSDITIKNGIDRLRGQGIFSGWPPYLEVIFFNKLHFLFVGILHWFSNLNLSIIFSQFDKKGILNFISMGAFPKITIIPYIAGIVILIRKNIKFFVYPLLLTLPAAIIYPQFSPRVIVYALPFLAYIITFGLFRIKSILSILILSVAFIELFMNFLAFGSEVKYTSDFRPLWIKPIIEDSFKLSNSAKVLISDDITEDIGAYILWFTTINPKDAYLNINYPYKFRQTNFGQIKLIGASDNLRICSTNENTKLFLSNRDLERGKNISEVKIEKSYMNSKGETVAYYIENRICI